MEAYRDHPAVLMWNVGNESVLGLQNCYSAAELENPGHRGVAPGATVFHYGTEYDFGGHWFNLTPAGERRKMYYAVKRAYGGNTAGGNLPPTVSVPTVPDPTAVAAGRRW